MSCIAYEAKDEYGPVTPVHPEVDVTAENGRDKDNPDVEASAEKGRDEYDPEIDASAENGLDDDGSEVDACQWNGKFSPEGYVGGSDDCWCHDKYGPLAIHPEVDATAENCRDEPEGDLEVDASTKDGCNRDNPDDEASAEKGRDEYDPEVDASASP